MTLLQWHSQIVSGSDFHIGVSRTDVEPDFDLQKFMFHSERTNGLVSTMVASVVKCWTNLPLQSFLHIFVEWSMISFLPNSMLEPPAKVSLSAEVRMRAEYNIKEKRKLRAVVEEKDILLKAKGEEVQSESAVACEGSKSRGAIRLRTFDTPILHL
ncbi:hypothetical protein Tco_0503743 [Tanacetum coccineum]